MPFHWRSRSLWTTVLHTMISSFLFLALVDTAPILSDEQKITPQKWGSLPSTRGTLSILFSCGAALLICVWTGVHLNVRPVEETYKQLETFSQVLEKLVWASVALLAPDIILVVALHQLLVAQHYRNFVNNTAQTPNEKRWWFLPKASKKGMGLRIAFFAIMGGFSVQVHNFNGTRNFALGFRDLKQLETVDIIHDFSKEEIKDKSKISTFAKTIACIQTGWVLSQCFGRQMEGIHITLLELNTAVHVLFAIVVYCIWWEKPVDVHRPILALRRGRFDVSHSTQINSIGQILERVGTIIDNSRIFNDGFNDPNPSNMGKGSINSELLSNEDALLRLQIARHVCEGIRIIPKEIIRRTKKTPEDIKDYLFRETKRDIASATLQYRFLSENPHNRIPLRINEASYSAAFDVTHRMAFNVANTGNFGDITTLGIQKTPTKGQSYHPRLIEYQELAILLDNALKCTRAITFRPALKAAFKAAEVEANNIRKHRNVPQTNIVGSSHVVLNAPLPDPSINSTTGDGLTLARSDDFLIQPPTFTHTIFAAVRTVRAATRAATRLAVRQAALGESLGKRGLAEAAGYSLKDYLIKELHLIRELQDSNNILSNQVDWAVGALHTQILKEFRDVKDWGALGSGVGTDIESTCRFVHWASTKSLYNVLYELFSIIQKSPNVHRHLREIVEYLQDEMDTFDGEKHHTDMEQKWWKGPQVSLAVGMKVLTNQVVNIPNFFGEERHWEVSEVSDFTRMGYRVNLHINDPSDDGVPGEHAKVHFTRKWRRWHRAIIIFVSSAMGAFYGAIHATKWNSHWFATPLEQLLWRISCVVGATAFIPITLILIALMHIPPKKKYISRLFVQIVVFSSLFFTASIFFAARIFLVVESFMGLRHLPPDAFKVVKWANAIPHF